jgi:hypothetical protein
MWERRVVFAVFDEYENRDDASPALAFLRRVLSENTEN